MDLLRIIAAVTSAVFCAGAYADEPAARGASIALECRNTSECTPEGSLVLVAAADEAEKIVVPFKCCRVELPPLPAGDWQLDVVSAGFWADGLTVAGGADSKRQYTIALWRTGRVAGRVLETPAAARPKLLRLVIETPPGARPELARTTIPCPVGDDGTWRCELPATLVDLAVRADGFAPHYRWETAVNSETITDIGSFRLVPGASVLVWLDHDTVKALNGATAVAKLVRPVANDPSPVGQRLAMPVAEARFSRRGVAQLAPVDSGDYVVEVSAAGFGTEQLGPLTVYEARETALRRPFALFPAMDLRISVEPPASAGGQRWQVEVSRGQLVGDTFTPVARGSVDEKGDFFAAGQSRGRYVVRVLDHQRNIFAERRFEISSDADATQAFTLTVDKVTGEVTLGGEPLRANLLFSGFERVAKISAASGDDGRFEVSLPAPGRWFVAVEAAEAGVASSVEVDVKGGRELSIELPDTSVSGWVVGPDGKRSGAAAITVSSEAGTMHRATDSAGAFRVRGVAAAPLRLRAADRRSGEYSLVVEVTPAEGKPVENVELVIESRRTVSGVVTSGGRPVIGARVHAYAMLGGAARQEQAISDVGGRFEVVIPVSASDVTFVVGAPGRVLQPFFLAAVKDAVTLDLLPSGGTLALSYPVAWQSLTLTYNNGLVPMHDVWGWARAQSVARRDDGVDVPNLAPGNYRLCVRPAGSTSDVCREGVLSPGGRLSLDVSG